MTADPSRETARLLTLSQEMVKHAKSAGADEAEAVLISDRSISTSVRLGALEEVESSEGQDLGLRVFIGQRQAVVSTTDFTPATLTQVAERAVAMARVAPEDPYCGLAPEELLTTSIPELDLDDPHELTASDLESRALEAEEAGRAVDGITNSEEASASWSRSGIAITASNGFAGSYTATTHGLSAVLLAGEGTGMERDYDFTYGRHLADLKSPGVIGKTAADRAVKRLNSSKPTSGTYPVIFDPMVASSLVGHFAGAISGSSVARGTSFLKEQMGDKVWAEGVTIIDDPRRIRGHASKPFDGEGVANERLDLVTDGILNTWLLDLASARQLNLTTNGRASRGTGSPPHPSSTNLYMAPGTISRRDLIKSVDAGFYITDLIGMGVNPVTGDYSRGASGFWIEKGELAGPVSEVTIAGNLKDMFLQITPADDLEFLTGTNAPTLRIESMTLAGT